jgi:HAD superfamily hydrolase (TIGR01549 family)
MQSTCDELGVPVEEFWERREAYAAELENQQLRNGGRKPFDDIETLERLARSHKLGVVSNNRQATVDQMISVCGLDFIEVAIGRDHSFTGYYDRKPEPTMLTDALRTLEADHALYVGDSAKDITAASSAGIDSAFVRRSHNTDLDLQEEPSVEIEGLVDLSEHVETE